MSESYNEGEKATITIMILSENKNLLKAKRGRALLTHCQQTKKKWEEYEELKLDMRLNNPEMDYKQYHEACLGFMERLDL